MLTLVDYATRYPEAVPLKNIDTETVAEAVLDLYSRVGIPEEALSDLGTQFVPECMHLVMDKLSVIVVKSGDFVAMGWHPGIRLQKSLWIWTQNSDAPQ